MVEAFVVLSIVFLIQYALAKVTIDDSSIELKEYFFVQVRQLETSGDDSNHLAYATVNGMLIDLIGQDNCPRGAPFKYPFEIENGVSKSREVVKEFVNTIEGRVRNLFVVFADSFNTLQKTLKNKKVNITVQPGYAGNQLQISGLHSSIGEEGLNIQIFSCICFLPYDGSGAIGLDKPHPLRITVTTISNDSVTNSDYVGYYHFTEPNYKGLNGVITNASNDWNKSYRKYQINYSADGSISASNLNVLTLTN